MGSFSKIEGLAKNDIYELYDAGGELTNVLQRRRFSTGMAAFLDCLKQLMDHVTAEDSSVRFPETCTISHDKIGEISIKLPFGSADETWTRALKSILRALKTLLLYATR
ncbi:hypothetical protein PIIN_09282 [Serendipita indica DSM 11827]|uniref:Atg6 BARA domain-containing protein n=1 Tax=Serendipita indica (strain DSM 11827) TaxID=1109443 RepID=G4TVF4_SERID|nr:hypothetical protein PIIN_09282 [Serendipita indica DSM 11827]